MSFSGTAEWLSAYVYTRGSLRDLLVERVAPFAAEMLDAGLAERFFFIRYWEGGPHLRLRFHGKATLLMPELERRFGESDDVLKLEYVAYEPEVDRYGGPAAIGLAEEWFALSSHVAFEVLRATDDDGARGAAMLLHVALAHAAGMTRAEAVEFFDAVARSRIFRDPERVLEELASRASVPAAPHVLWDALEHGRAMELPWLEEWIAGVRGLVQRLAAVPVRTEMPLPQHLEEAIPPRFRMPWMLLSSQVHMTNNRLGITSLDEPYLAWLVARALAR
ncbi:MAG TPA: thiopeptide-type bacteriocin biosynthesis protein [Thermoanaerobaculia bacterium]|nr:thiopeptide-type bacteriocin biosynthesis protein [Thermoanaerobaculia bacterium]